VGPLVAAFILVAAGLVLRAEPASADLQQANAGGLFFFHSRLCLNVPGSSTGVVQVVQWGCGSGLNDNLVLVPVGDGRPSYFLKPQHALSQNLCLDVEGSSTANGTRILQYSCTGNANQKFSWKSYKYGMRVTAIGGKCLDIPGDGTAWGLGVTIWDCVDYSGSSYQRFEDYCRICASNYADSWALSYNPSYSAALSPNDCQDFVSQAVAAGGMSMNYGGSWYYAGNYGYSTSWNGTAPAYSFFTTPGVGQSVAVYPPGSAKPNFTVLAWGDIVYYNWMNDPGYGPPNSHSSVLVGWSDHDYVDSHTEPRYHVWWDLRGINLSYDFTRVELVRITGPGYQW
jgi:hypothetical protein